MCSEFSKKMPLFFTGNPELLFSFQRQNAKIITDALILMHMVIMTAITRSRATFHNEPSWGTECCIGAPETLLLLMNSKL